MEDQQANSIPALIRSVLDDARELIREEIAVARSEIREENVVGSVNRARVRRRCYRWNCFGRAVMCGNRRRDCRPI